MDNMSLLILVLPWILLGIANILIMPIALYVSGKWLRINAQNFTFWECFWISLVAGLFAGLLSSVNIYLSLGVYLVLLGYMLSTRFKLSAKILVLVLPIMIGLSIFLSFAQTFAVNSLMRLQFSPDSPVSQLVKPEKEEGKLACSLLSAEDASKALNLELESKAGRNDCDFYEGYKRIFTIQYLPEEEAKNYTKNHLVNNVMANYEVEEELDAILEGAYIIKVSLGDVESYFMIFEIDNNVYQFTENVDDFTIDQFKTILKAIIENEKVKVTDDIQATEEIEDVKIKRVTR